MSRRALVGVGVALVWPVVAFADTGRPGFAFLNLGTSARLEAMGGVGTTVGEGADALDWNPARLGSSPGRSATASGFNWLDDVVGMHGAAAVPTDLGTFGVGVRSLAVGSFDNTDLEEPVDQSDLAIAVGYARGLGDRWSAGVAGKMLRSSLAGEDATGFGLDAGVDYRWVRGFDLVAAVRNVGPAVAYGSGPDEQLPTQFRAGLGGTSSRFRYGAEAVWENGPDWSGTVGAEARFFRRVAVRAGSALGGPESVVNPWSVGAGVTVRPGLRVDYAFRDGDVAASHRIGLSWQAGGGGAEESQARSAKEFYEAVVDKALAEGLKDVPGAAGDSVIVRAESAHDAAEVVSARVAEALRARGLRVEVRQPVPVLPDSLRQANAAQLAAQGLTKQVDLPLLEVAIRSSKYEILRESRDRWIGPKTVERSAGVELGFAWKLPDREEPTWRSAGSASDVERVAADRVPRSSGYPRANAAGLKKPSRLVEPAIVSGIVAGLAALFFSNRNVGN